MTRFLFCFAPLLLLFTGCATSSAAFVKQSQNMSIVRGEILKVEGLQSRDIQRFADGVAVTVNDTTCQVTIRLSKKNEQTYPLAPGTILVFGKKVDYIMRDAADYVPAVPSN